MTNTTQTAFIFLLIASGGIWGFGADPEHYVDKLHLNRDSTQASYISNNHDPFIYSTDNFGTSYPFTDGDLGHLVIQPRTSTPKDIIFATGAGTPEPRMIVKGSGDVGIGATVPQHILEIAAVNDSMGLGGILASGDATGLQFLDYGNQHVGFRWNGNGNRDLVFEDSSSSTSPLTWYSGQKANFVVRNGDLRVLNGAVAIGTDTPDPAYGLSVNGTIRAKEIIVDTGWSDFVFEDGYALKSLSEVESHIAEHGHLPDVPSAAEVESEGLSVGEAQKVMMQKIEELTLYVIELKKDNEGLRGEVNELKSKISL